MIEKLIQAKDCLFQVKTNDLYVDMLCLKSFSVTVNTDEKEITTVGDGAYKAFDYKVLSYTCNVNGAMRIPDNVSPTTFDILEYQRGFIPIQFRVVWVDPQGDEKTFVGTGIVKTSNMVTNASQLADGTFDILGTGPFEIGDTSQDFINLRIISTGAPSAPGFAKFKLINSEGEVIWQTDTQPQANGSYLSNPFDYTFQVTPGMYFIYWYYDSNVIGNTINVNTPVAYNRAFNNGVQSESTFGIQDYDFTADRTVTFTLGVNNPPPGCVPPTIQQGIVSPSGETGTYFSRTVIIGGSTPISVSNVTKPAWMTISVSGNVITCEGYPNQGLNQILSFDVTNACGTVSYSTEIDIILNPFSVVLNYAYTEAVDGASCSFLIFKNAVQIVAHSGAASGSVLVNNGDVIQVRVIGGTLVQKSLKVEGSSSGTLFDSFTFAPHIDYIFTADSAETPYTITAHGGS